MSSSSTDQETKKREHLPLLDIHGHGRIQVKQCFPSGEALTKFLKDLCYNQNKALYITKTSSGKSKTYKCPDPDCQWHVRGYRAVDKVTWFLRACQRAGISFDKRPLFCDRGHIRGAVTKIHREVLFTIKRVVPNNAQEIPNEKNPLGQRFEHAVWKLQALETKEEFDKAFDVFKETYGGDVGAYLEGINPRRWTVHANVTCHEHKRGTIQDDFGPMRALPMFNWRTTNFVESDNSAMLSNGVHHSNPCDAFVEYTLATMIYFSTRDLLVKKWEHERRTVTDHATKLWDKEKEEADNYEVIRSRDDIYFV